MDQQAAARPSADRAEIARRVWAEHLPATEHELAARQLAHFTYHVVRDRPKDGTRPPASVTALVRQGWLRAEPLVYEDFLPRSAAGIFQSNLTGKGSRDNDQAGTAYDIDWLSAAIDRDVLDPFDLYAQAQDRSLARAARELGVSGPLS